MAKNAFNQRKELLSKSLNKDIKKRIIKAIVWSVALYAAETSTYRKEDIRRLEAFEMWVLRRMEKVCSDFSHTRRTPPWQLLWLRLPLVFLKTGLGFPIGIFPISAVINLWSAAIGLVVRKQGLSFI